MAILPDNKNPQPVQQTPSQPKRKGTGFTNLSRILQASQGSKLGQTYHGEICYNFFSGKTYKITYEQLAQQTITAFMESKSHKAIMLSHLTCPSKQYGHFSTTSTLKNGYFNFFVTGFFTYHID